MEGRVSGTIDLSKELETEFHKRLWLSKHTLGCLADTRRDPEAAKRMRRPLDKIPSLWDNPTMIVKLDSKRRLTLPAALMPAQPGQSFDVRFDADEDALIVRRLPEREDWLQVLAECPVPMDDLPPCRRELPKKRKL